MLKKLLQIMNKVMLSTGKMNEVSFHENSEKDET